MSEERKLQFHGGIGMSLIPVAIYVFFCMVLFIGFKAFNMEALAVGGFLALLIGGMFCTSYSEFWESAIKGISSITSVSVVVILLLVGMFSALIKLCGLSGGFVWIANAVGMKGGIFVAFTFLAACIVSTATGSSIGTMFIAFPIFYPAGIMLGANEMMMAGSIVSGAIFGDNLAPISDTTIAATRSQHCEMRDKFRVNFMIALPAAILTIVVLLLVGRPETVTAVGDLSYSFIKVIPYLLVLILALVGMNVFLVLTIGIFAAGIVGIATGSMDLAGFAQAIYNGFCGMNEVFFLTLLCGGLSELIAKNGGIEWIIQKLHNVMKGNKSAQVGIAAMVSFKNLNNVKWKSSLPKDKKGLQQCLTNVTLSVLKT